MIITLDGLRPGTQYSLFVTYTTPEYYEPILYAETANISQVDFFTLPNPNIHNNSKAYLLEDLQILDPELYLILSSRLLREDYIDALNSWYLKDH